MSESLSDRKKRATPPETGQVNDWDVWHGWRHELGVLARPFRGRWQKRAQLRWYLKLWVQPWRWWR